MNTLLGEPIQKTLLRWYGQFKKVRADEPSMLEVGEAMYRQGVRDAIRASAELAEVVPTLRLFLGYLGNEQD